MSARYSTNRSYRDASSVIEEEVVETTRIVKIKKNKQKESKFKNFFKSWFHRKDI
jgi:hypothetical protein